MKSGELHEAILRYKFNGRWAWGIIFARVLNGFLYENRQLVAPGALIIPMPTYVEPGADRHADHTRWVIEQAAAQDDQNLPYVYEPPVVVKTGPTQKLKLLGAADRRAEALEIRKKLQVPDSSRIQGREILVYDDVFTTGATLNAVADVLLEAGASRVDGVVLSRQPW